jgi:uncharacterized protein (DUF2062 family)
MRYRGYLSEAWNMIFSDRLRRFYKTFISLKGEPAEIATGMAMGVFISVTPTIPFHTVLIFLIGVALRQNITAAYLSSWIVSNPVTIPLLYISQYKLGRFILGMSGGAFHFQDYNLRVLAALGSEIIVPLLVGGICMAPLFAVPAYFISLHFIKRIRNRRTP